MRCKSLRLIVILFLYLGLGFWIQRLFHIKRLIDPEALLLKALEKNFSAEWSTKYTSELHLPGTNFNLAEWTKSKFEEYGFKSTIDTYEVFLSYPKNQSLTLIDGESTEVLFRALLKEDEIEEDKTSLGGTSSFLSYAANGNVTAEYVFANYGTIDDFNCLKLLGVEIKGKIAVIRYGKIFRGLKVKFAQENGMIGVLLYTDPSEDSGMTPKYGYKQYPDGPARQESSIERGSVQFFGGTDSAPGDPTTPGVPSKPGVERKTPYNSIGTIPVLAISYREVTPILSQLNGHGIRMNESNWRGELDEFDYWTGPNTDRKLILFNDQHYNITPIWNVYGELEGEAKDEVIIVGNHRDSWTKGGAGDPNSGSAALIELARALGSLKDSGFKFQRSIILQSFDGEEYGLLGSTEQGEYFAEELRKKAVAYLNMDAAALGTHLKLGSSPLLNKVLYENAKKLPYPKEDSSTLYDHFLKEANGTIKILGTGSDYTVYLEHLGIPSSDIEFARGNGDPIYPYHTNYDSYNWMSKYGDPDFVFHNLAAKYLGLITLDLATSPIIPFSLSDYSSELIGYFNEVVSLVPRNWIGRQVDSALFWSQIYQNLNEDLLTIRETTGKYYKTGPTKTIFELLGFSTDSYSNHIDFTSTSKDTTVQDLLKITENDLRITNTLSVCFDKEARNLEKKTQTSSNLHWRQKIMLKYNIRKYNKFLQYFERNFIYSKGLHRRSWYKHMVFASDRKAGYDGIALPGLKEAIEDEDIDRFIQWLGILSSSLRSVNRSLPCRGEVSNNTSSFGLS